MPHEEGDRLLCMREGEAAYVTPGAVLRNCMTCGHSVHISPSGLEIMDATGAKPECSHCAMTALRENPGTPVVAPMTPMMQAEIAEALKEAPENP